MAIVICEQSYELSSFIFRAKRGRPVIKGASALGGDWQPVTEENKAQFKFFKVEVVLP